MEIFFKVTDLVAKSLQMRRVMEALDLQVIVLSIACGK